MNNTRIPVDDSYAMLLGKAVYVFAYYEWTIIWIIESLQPGFVRDYCRKKILTSGGVKKELQEAIQQLAKLPPLVSTHELQTCCDQFGLLIDKRNALVHAHPSTDSDGTQVLNFQAKTTKPLPDMKWPNADLESLISEFDQAACDASKLLEKFRRCSLA